MGQTWNEFRRQCGLAIGAFGVRQRISMNEPLTAGSLRELSIELFKGNYIPENDDEREEWERLIDELRQINIRSKAELLAFFYKHLDSVREEDRQRAKGLLGSGWHKKNHKERFEQLSNGYSYAAVGIVRRCYFAEITK